MLYAVCLDTSHLIVAGKCVRPAIPVLGALDDVSDDVEERSESRWSNDRDAIAQYVYPAVRTVRYILEILGQKLNSPCASCVALSEKPPS